MSVTVRELPREEWAKLETAGQPEMAGAWQNLRDQPVRAMVAEDDGRIVAHWSLIQVPHTNALWVHPDYRGTGGICHALLEQIGAAVREGGCGFVWIGTDVASIQRLAESLGGMPMTGLHYLVSVGRR